MRTIILSRQRVDTLRRCSWRFFPYATVCVAESEVNAYRAITPDILPHPDSVSGMGPLRQWVVANVPDEVVVMVADAWFREGVQCP